MFVQCRTTQAVVCSDVRSLAATVMMSLGAIACVEGNEIPFSRTVGVICQKLEAAGVQLIEVKRRGLGMRVEQQQEIQGPNPSEVGYLELHSRFHCQRNSNSSDDSIATSERSTGPWSGAPRPC